MQIRYHDAIIMEFDPELWLRIKNKKITAHQMQILSELGRTRSQTKAAANLKISVPVFHRHLKSLIDKLGTELVVTTPNGTWLTTAGKNVLKIYERYFEMLKPEESIILCATPITHNLLLETITRFETTGKKYLISINDDQQNLKALYLGKADLVIFDDPNYAMDFEGVKEDKILALDIFSDTLVHSDNGPDYIRYKYGAQRLGFRFLEANQKRYNILYEVSDFKHILDSGKSFFINQSYATNKNFKISSYSDAKMLQHPIIAVSINPTNEIRNIVAALRKRADAASLGIRE